MNTQCFIFTNTKCKRRIKKQYKQAATKISLKYTCIFHMQNDMYTKVITDDISLSHPM